MRRSFLLVLGGTVLVSMVTIFGLRSHMEEPDDTLSLATPARIAPTPNLDSEARKVTPPESDATTDRAPSAAPDEKKEDERVAREATFHQRLADVNAMGPDLPAQKVAELCDYLRDTDVGQYTIKNDVLTVLRKQRVRPSALTDVLVEIFSNPRETAVMRDYVLQHASLWYTEVGSDAGRRKLEPLFWEALKHTDSSIAGTGLLALQRLGREYPKEFGLARIGREAKTLAENEKASSLSRTAALHVCALLQVKEVLPVCVRVANEGGSLPFQLAALAAIGELGGTSDTELLDAWALAGEEPLSIAASHARARLKERLGI